MYCRSVAKLASYTLDIPDSLLGLPSTFLFLRDFDSDYLLTQVAIYIYASYKLFNHQRCAPSPLLSPSLLHYFRVCVQQTSKPSTAVNPRAKRRRL